MDTYTDYGRQENAAVGSDQNGHTQSLCAGVQALEEEDPASRSRGHHPSTRQGQ